MTMFPDVQKKAQAELDATIGTSRFPTLSDNESLPYINALVKEVLRWHPINTFGLPHCTKQNDEYDGYFIPNGTAVLANLWYAHLSLDAFYEADAYLLQGYVARQRALPRP